MQTTDRLSPRLCNLAVLTACIACISMPATSATSAPPVFKREAWLQDYASLKTQLEQRYSHLAWFGSPQSGVNLPALERRTRRALKSAENGVDARAALVDFIAGFHDGHLKVVPTRQAGSHQPAPPAVQFDKLSAAQACAALGYTLHEMVTFSAPFESLRDYALRSDGITHPFRAGVVQSAQGRRIGIIRIPSFRENDTPPDACIREWNRASSSKEVVSLATIRANIDAAWFQSMAAQLKQFQADGVAAVLVDVGTNPGGGDSGDWASRLFTPGDVHSARLLISAEPLASKYLDEELRSLQQGLDRHPEASAETKQTLENAIRTLKQRKADLGTRKTDMSWVWRTQRPWNPASDNRLINVGYASGQIDYLPVGALGGTQLASRMYWAAEVDHLRGAWSGPVYVLTDNKTASSAEMFAAVMRDNGIAKTIGDTTLGAGAGSMFSAPEIVLPYSGMHIKFPNAVRLRGDGSDEVAGIKPDLPVLPMQDEPGRNRAARIVEAIAADLPQAAQP